MNVVAIFRDEAPYLAEWIEFHRLQGFDHFLLYDNDSVDDSGDIARHHGAEVVWRPGFAQQLPAYGDAISRLPRGEWTAFIDIDEYLHCPDGRRVIDKIEEMYASEQALGVPWCVFGSNGHLDKPGGLTIESYVRREAEANQHVKTILRNGCATHFPDPHRANVADTSTWPEIVCNHYWSRSLEEVTAKFGRGRADTGQVRGMHEFWAGEIAFNAVEDTAIIRNWSEALRRVLRA